MLKKKIPHINQQRLFNKNKHKILKNLIKELTVNHGILKNYGTKNKSELPEINKQTIFK